MSPTDWLLLLALIALTVGVFVWAWPKGDDTDDGSGDDPGPY
jgi:hypothetical protein